MIGSHKTTVGQHGNWLDVCYHSTDVASRHDDGRIVLRTGGWRTVTTKKRINQALETWGSPYRVYQEAFAWYVVRLPWAPGPNRNTPRIAFDGDTLELPA